MKPVWQRRRVRAPQTKVTADESSALVATSSRTERLTARHSPSVARRHVLSEPPEASESVRACPVAVIIPTYGRGARVLTTLAVVFSCDPTPCEVWVHVDQSNGDLEAAIAAEYPTVQVLTSTGRIGPGGGRHRCLSACEAPYAVSFDDDSYPIDSDFFGRVQQILDTHPEAAIVGASIFQRGEETQPCGNELVRRTSYIGCGYAVRLSDYRRTRGYLPRAVPYGIEETDLALQLFAAGRCIYEAGALRVFHDTDLRHHQEASVTKGVVENVALFAYLHYPSRMWPRACAQIGNTLAFCLKRGRWAGVLSGLIAIPGVCRRYRSARNVLPAKVVREFLALRRVRS